MRADKFFADKFGSRTKAKEKLLRGLIYANGKQLSPDSELTGGESFLFTEENSFVSRGGDKLERGLSVFNENVDGCVFADFGASTGGFTDCLLRRGAKKVYCIDVGENQLDETLVKDERVVVLDKTNVRYLTKDHFQEPLNGIVSDLSFISLKLVLPVVARLFDRDERAFMLFKPQFECGRGKTGKSGILPVRCHEALLSEFYDVSLSLGLNLHNIVNAPLREGKNVEYVVYLSKSRPALDKREFLRRAADFYENRT